MAAQLPTISVVMPVLNRADTLERALGSIVEQAYPQVELIVLDGGSTDGSVEIIKKYAHHIAYWQSGPDGGAAIVTNSGIERATGDLVVIFMADDWFESDTFRKIGDAYLADPEADIFTCGGRIVRWDEKTKDYQPLLAYTTQEALALTFYNISFAVSAICARFIRKSLYERIGLFIPFDADGKQILANDKEFLMRAMMAGARDVFVPHLGHTYLAHAQSFSFGSNRNNKMRHCQEHMEIAQTYLKRGDLRLKDRLFLMYWYNNQSAKLLWFKLFDKDFSAARSVAVDGITRYGLIWPVMIVGETIRLGCKKVINALTP